MTINFENRMVFDELRTHDGIFTGFVFDYNNKDLCFEVLNREWGYNFRFKFNNVIYFDMQNCDFWGPGPHIYCSYIDEDSSKIKELKNFAEEKEYKDTKLDEGIFYITVKFELNSGNVLEIVCESVEVVEDRE